jgi:hypothetical protein
VQVQDSRNGGEEEQLPMSGMQYAQMVQEEEHTVEMVEMENQVFLEV